MKIQFPDIDLFGVKAALIDLDDTLYCYQQVHELALDHCYADEIAEHFSYQDFLDEYKKARQYVTELLYPQGACRSRLFAFQKLFTDKNIFPAYRYANKFENKYWDTFIQHITVEEDALSFLTRCQSLGIKVCVVTDMLAGVQIKKLEKLNITQYIDYLVSSEEAGAEKPHHSIFNLALERVKAKSSEVIMIGDSLHKDIKGADALGIRVYQVISV